jgi:hypothetical protein
MRTRAGSFREIDLAPSALAGLKNARLATAANMTIPASIRRIGLK